ncbi:3472_t:CDS:10 [Diversispora eburnea]|uniref:3472_t:CDS:1 n=1 Tax=Diversispora eburnea TaxID=1213867 RepID=A0A9N8W1R1_9GLOM|nr:3472_t:CDS:10 [Diversispora eburnea]
MLVEYSSYNLLLYPFAVFLIFIEIIQLCIEEMSVTIPPKVIVPSHKPLPALPTENSSNEINNNIKILLSYVPPLPRGTNDLALDNSSLSHIRKILRQCLSICVVDSDPWESIILGIILDIAETVPKAIKAIYEKHEDYVASNNEELNEKNDELNEKSEKSEKNEELNEKNYSKQINIQKPLVKFVINFKKEDGKPRSDIRLIGGTIILKGNRHYINRIDKILELMVFVVCNLKLEMCMYRDHSVLRTGNKDILDAEEIQNTLRNSRRSSKSSWFGWLMKNNNLSRIKEHPIKIIDKHGTILSKRKSGTPSVTKESSDEDEDIIVLSKNKFANVITQMENSILSSSPGVKFPPPHLLTRLKDEETEIISLNDGDERSFKSYVSKDVRELARALSNDSNTINSLEKFWSPTSPVPCHNHEIIRMDYYNKTNCHSDKSLGEMIDDICNKANETCEEPSCDHPGKDHITTYTHNDGRISITVEESPDQKLKYFSNNIIMWTQCKLCSSRTSLVLMSESTYYYSFAKYLEILFYNENFACKGLCQHAELRDSLLRCFRRGDLEVKVEYEHVDLFEMRLPKLQINHDANQAYSSLGGSEKLFTICDKVADMLYNETRLEITNFYGSVKQFITLLEEYFDNLPNKKLGSSNVNENEKEKSGYDKSMENLKSLEELTQNFRTEEFELYNMLKKTKVTVLNNVRQAFVERIRATKKRLTQWNKDHIDPVDLESIPKMEWVEPEYVNDNCHVFTGSPIIIREDEPSSIIAFTLSSQDYLNELTAIRYGALPKSQSAPTTPSTEHRPPQSSSSFSTLLSSLRNPSSSSLNNKNPSSSSLNNKKDSDSDSVDGDSFTLVDEYSTKIKRKWVNVKDNGFITHGIETTLGSMKAFNISSLSSKEKKKDHDKDSEKTNPSRSGKFAGLFGMNNVEFENHKEKDNKENEGKENEKQKIFNEKQEYNEKKSEPPRATIEINGHKLNDDESSVHNTFRESIGWSRKNSQKDKERTSPHIKYDAVHRNKRFTCTVYFASEFDSLRRRCGIEDLCIDSLSRCSPWQTTGGKSASTFLKTQDNRLVIKQMVSSWRIAEKEGFLKIAPKYFEYMNKRPNMPSVLAKIFGFYTIKIKDLKNNVLKMDVLVMEHLFFEKTITSKFDLKGIQERHIRDQTKKDDVTLWDGDWVEGRYKSRLLIYSHSKKLLKEALDNDTQFLCDANIMDYSLLVGVDDEKKELIVGIVDFIGAYTLYKRIENRGKTLSRNAKDVTVLPPDQYKERFRDSMDQYFLQIPGFYYNLLHKMYVETVYATHTFRAEHGDEVNFQYGEPIIVLEKDEMYGDGWWQGQNIHGQIGLFPMNYTSYDKPPPINPNTNDITSAAADNHHFNSTTNNIDDVKENETPTNTINSIGTISGLQNKLHKLVTKKKSEAKLNKLSVVNNKSNISEIKKETTPQIIVQPQSNRESISSTIINDSEDLNKNNLNNLSNKISPQPSSSIEKGSKVDSTNTLDSTSKFNNHFNNWHPSTWNMEQVCQWLKEKGLESVMDQFVENDITGDVLIGLNLESLKELNIMSYGKRVHIINAIESLKNDHSLNKEENNYNQTLKVKVNDENVFYNDFESSRSSQTPTINKSNTDNSQYSNERSSEGEKPMNRRTLSKKGSKIFSRLTFSNKNDREEKEERISHSLSLRVKNSPIKKEKLRLQSNGGWDFLMEEENEMDLKSRLEKKSKKKDLRIITPKNSNPLLNSSNLDNKNDSEYRNFYYEHPVDEFINEEEEIIDLKTPDYEGWLKKQGDKYKSWKNRYCILKGVNLFYLRSDKNKKNPQIKGHLNLTGYRIVPDENILQGKYGFKLIHDTERTYYFAHDDLNKMRDWMKAMMKATISRDVKTPVVSSSNMATMPLSEARQRIRSPTFADTDSLLFNEINSPPTPVSRSTSPISTRSASPRFTINQQLSFPSMINRSVSPSPNPQNF